MKINGHELEFRLSNAAMAERYEQALAEMRQGCQTPASGSLAQVIRAQTALVRAFVDRLFGQGTYQALGLDLDELEENLAAMRQIVEESGRQAQAVKTQAGRYSPDKVRRGK